MHEGKTATSDVILPWPLRLALTISILGIFYLGLAPKTFLGLSTLAILHPLR